MFKKIALVAGISLAVSAAAQAQQAPQKTIVTGDTLVVDTYRWEIGGAANYSELDVGPFDIDKWGVDLYGTYFLRDVNTNKGPRSEAAFLDHASSVTLFGGYSELDDVDKLEKDLGGIDIDDDDSETYGIGGRYVTKQTGSWIIQADWRRTKPAHLEIDTYTIGIGKYITDNTSLIITYADADLDNGGDTDGWNAGLEHFWRLSSGGIKMEGNVGYVNVDDGDDIDIYNLAGTWYVTDNLGFGARYGKIDGGGAEADNYSVFSEWFINKHVAVSVAYDYTDFDDSDVDNNAFTIGGRYRF
jgi:opacity protein-like surface antigen